jgi:hypothetical protein
MAIYRQRAVHVGVLQSRIQVLLDLIKPVLPKIVHVPPRNSFVLLRNHRLHESSLIAARENRNEQADKSDAGEYRSLHGI